MSCFTNHKKSSDIITINVLKALDNPRPFKLSEMVENIEVVELESNKESFFYNSGGIRVGKKFILVFDSGSNKVLLFDRSGKFLYKIGKEGKGPGEYIELLNAAIDDDEGQILLGDVGGKKLLLFNINGKFIGEHPYDIDTPGFFIKSIYFVDKYHFGICFQTPRQNTSGFSKVLLYNTDFNLLKEIFPVINEEGRSFDGPISNFFYPVQNGFQFWAGSKDTVFNMDFDLNYLPEYNLLITKGAEDKNYFIQKNGNPYGGTGNYSKVDKIYDYPRYFLAYFRKRNDRIHLIGYDKIEKELFTVSYSNDCDTTNNNYPSIENDLFGIDPIFLRDYNPKLNTLLITYDVMNFADRFDYDCLLDKKVIKPAIRDEIVKKIKNFTGEENPILVIMKLKE